MLKFKNIAGEIMASAGNCNGTLKSLFYHLLFSIPALVHCISACANEL